MAQTTIFHLAQLSKHFTFHSSSLAPALDVLPEKSPLSTFWGL